MRFFSTIATLAFLTNKVSAQGSASLEPREGYKTTDIFLPYATNGSYITALGSTEDTTTWGFAENEAQLTDPPTTFTMEPTRMVYNVSTQNVTQIGTQVYLSAFIVLNCSYTSTSSETSETTWRVTATCEETTAFENEATGRLKADYFTWPEFYGPTLTDVSTGTMRPTTTVRPTASSDGGWVAVYANPTPNSSSQGRGRAELMAIVKKVVVVAAVTVVFFV